MSYLDHVKKSDGRHTRRTLIYGTHGVGKTTWASRWPNPVLLPTEDGHRDVDVPAGPVIKTTAGLLSAIKDVTASDFSTVIIDSIDWAEKNILAEIDKEGVDTGWGKGDKEVAVRLGKVLAALDECRDAGKHIILIGHEHLAKVVRPDGKEYGTRTVNLTKLAARRVCEWCDEVLFAEADITVKSSDGKFGGIAVDKKTRSLYTSSSPLRDAKHRLKGLPDRFELGDVESYLSFVLGE